MLWLFLLLIPLALSSAQNPNAAGGSNSVNTAGAPDTSNNRKFQINVIRQSRTYCTTSDGKDGECVNPNSCQQNLPVQDPTTLFTPRTSTCILPLQCCPLDQIKATSRKTNQLPPGCGWSNPDGTRFRSVEPNFAEFADFPWMVALLKRSFGATWSPQDYLGGGTLIQRSVVLTVAHKVFNLKPDQLKCRAGEWDFRSNDESFPHQDSNVQRIAVHNKALLLRVHYDVALLFLETAFKLRDVYHIGTACLARDMPTPGTLCYSMGWGRSFNDTNKTSLLKKVPLSFVDPQLCQEQLRRTRLGPKFELHFTQMCAGGEAGVDTCVGDGGASLVCPVPSDNGVTRYVVYGVVTSGVDCGRKDVPGVYAKIPALIDWIDREMQEEQLGSSSYSLDSDN